MEKARQYSALSGVALVVLALSPALAGEGQGPAPGLELIPLSAEVDPEVQALRLRFMAPRIGAPGFDLEGLSTEMERLCQDALRARAPEIAPGALIIVSISDREVELGRTDPDAVQVFQSFEYVDGDCIWSHF